MSTISDAARPHPQAARASQDPLRELQALRRVGLGAHVLEARRLLGEITEPFELESAGRMLSAEQQLGELRETGTLPETSLVIYGSSTLDALPPLLTANLLRDGVLLSVALAGFNAWRTDILGGAPQFAHMAPAPVVLILDDTVIFDEVTEAADVDDVLDACARLPEQLARWVARTKELLGSVVIVATVPLSSLRRDTIVDYRGKARLEAGWARMNAQILDLSAECHGVVTIAHDAVAAHSRCLFASDRMRHIAGTCFAAEYLAALATEVGRVVVAQMGLAKKCLVLDLDNTLWGGVLGDDGLGGIQLGGGYPGSAHLELQLLAASLSAQGVMLAVASKNHEDIVDQAMSDHPDMVLRADAVLARRVDFKPKPEHLRSIAEELNIGVDALVFVDDSPVERGLMRAMQPAITVVDVGEDPADFAARLSAQGPFNVLSRTDEDARRTESYQADKRRTQLLDGGESLESYLTGLGSALALSAPAPTQAVRTAQLFGKTNQFNLTGLRYTVDDITEASRQDRTRFVVGRLTDIFGDSGLIVAAAVKDTGDATWSIENVVLSCRAFSRDVESAMLAAIVTAAAAGGARHVRGRFVPTAKNRLFADVFSRHGFEQVGPPAAGGATTWELLSDAPPVVPDWITVTQSQETLHVIS